MEQYARDYPSCRFVGFWRRYKTSDEFDEYSLIYKENWNRYKQQNIDDKKDALPWPADLIDERQDPLVLEIVAQYLDDCPFGEHYMGFSTCRVCGKHLGCSDRTDGEWVWPDELSHYLRAHNVRLPDDFIEHVLKAKGEYMGREIRKVPSDWKHPTYKDVGKEYETKICRGGWQNMADRFHPMHDELFDNMMDGWYEEWTKWRQGIHPDQKTFSDKANMSYIEWNGGPPEPAYYRHRKWTDEEATHFQMYETVSEGTPVSPVFASLQELEDWLVEDGNWKSCDWPQGPISREAAHAFCSAKWAFSMVITSNGEILNGAETALAMKRGEDV
jgi:hypothetical protein